MSDVTLAGPPLTYITWGCKRCGFRGGTANTTFPIAPNWNEEMGRTLFTELRKKLMRKHLERHRCMATMEDFIITPFVPQGKSVVGVV